MSKNLLTKSDLKSHDAVGLIIKNHEGKYLCFHHRKFDFWTIPIGKAESDQTPEEAALKEAQEECGIIVHAIQKKFQGTKEYKRKGKLIKVFFFLYEITKYKGEIFNKEPDKHLDMQFVSIDEIRQFETTSDATKMFLKSFEEPTKNIADTNLSKYFRRKKTVGLCGASGSGKTTFSKFLSENFNAKLSPEGVRKWLSENGNLKYSELTKDQYSKLQLFLLDKFQNSDATIFDRTPLDAMAYLSIKDSNIDLNKFNKTAIECIERIDVIFLFPMFAPHIKDDGVRPTDLMHHLTIVCKILQFVHEFSLSDKLLVYDHSLSNEENASRLSEFMEIQDKKGHNKHSHE